MTEVRDEFFEDLLSDFLDESDQLLTRLGENLLELDQWASELAEGDSALADKDLINEMFRSAHSIKGLSGMLGLNRINGMTHKIENVFDAARKDELLVNSDVVELMFQSVDRLVAMVDHLKEHQTDDVDCEKVMTDISVLLRESGVEKQQTSQADAENALADLIGGGTPDQSSAQVEEVVAPSDQATNDSIESPQSADDAPALDLFADIVDDEPPAKYLPIFIDETELSVDSLTATLLSTESTDCREAIDSLLITSHCIKGSAASVGLNRPAKLAHLMEDIFQELRDNHGQLTSEVTDVMLQCVDALRTYVEGLKTGNPKSDGFNQLACELLAAHRSGDSPVSSNREPASDEEPADSSGSTESMTWESHLAVIRETAPLGLPVIIGQVFFEEDLPIAGLKGRLGYEKLSRLGEVFYCHPEAEKLDAFDTLRHFTFGIATETSSDELRKHLCFAGVKRIELQPVTEKDPVETAATSDQSERLNEPAATVGNDSLVQKTAAQEKVPSVSDSKTPVDQTSDVPSASQQKTTKPKTPTQKPPARSPSGGSANKPTETLRVDIERLDQLMNLAGQLIINKARFTRIGNGLKDFTLNKQTPHLVNNICVSLERIASASDAIETSRHVHNGLEMIRSQIRGIHADMLTVQSDLCRISQMHGTVTDLHEAVHQLDRVADGIQKSIMDTRMVPVGPLFTRFRRVIRDITRDNGKDIRLVIHGEKTELDKRMIDELSDPLIHMVRNSADHGVESPDDRIAAGKPPQGTITLDATHRGNSIIISVVDDGKGIHPEAILSKALEKGIVSQADSERMTPLQILQLIWEPGFSMAKQVTAISGRGMGMDIVRSKIEDLNGVVELDSEPGIGTTFSIKLPLTMAILPSLLAKIDGDVFAIPVESVNEIVSVSSDDLSTMHGLPTALVRGRVVSVVALDQVFTWNDQTTRPNRFKADGEILVILGTKGHEIGLSVDTLLGEEDIVIKSMAENFHNVYGISGASILGDGRVSLILDPSALLEISAKKSSHNQNEDALQLV